MALFNDQQQQQQDEEQPNQMQPYGVCVGTRRLRTVQRVPYVPDMNIGRHLFRARQLPAHPVREQQHVMLQDRINQEVQHNIRQDNIAYNRRLYDDPHLGINSTAAYALEKMLDTLMPVPGEFILTELWFCTTLGRSPAFHQLLCMQTWQRSIVCVRNWR